MNKRYKVLLLVFAFAVSMLLGACNSVAESSETAHNNSTPESTVTTLVTTTDPELPAPEPDDSEKYRMKDKFTYLSCLEGEYDIPELVSIGDGKLLIMNWQFNDDSTSATLLQIIDILEDRIIAEYSLEGYVTFESLTNNGFIVKSIDSMEFCFFDDDLNFLKSYKPESFYGKWSPDGKKYYQVISGKLYCEDPENGEITRIQMAQDLGLVEYIDGVSADGRYINLTYEEYSEDFYSKTASVRVDLDSNSIDMLTFDITYPSYSDDYMYSRVLCEDNYSEKLYRISLDTSDCVVFSLSQYDIEHVYGSDFLKCTEISDAGYGDKYLGYIDDNGKCVISPLTSNDPEEFFNWFTYMPQEKLIACFSSKNGKTSICLIEPSLLEFNEEIAYEKTVCPLLYNEQIYKDYLEASKIPECRPELKTLRDRADEIEEKYGIKIYLSSECKNMVTQIEYDCTDEYFESHNEYTFLESALYDVEETLAKYPDGFFEQFRRITGDGGIRICLTGYIHDDFSAAYAVQTGDWYNIVIDVRFNCAMNLPHELWHSTESYINNKNSSLITDEIWMAFNPEGFEYSDEFKESSQVISEYCYFYDDDWYFYDSYSKVNSFEDKARIMEIVMSPDIYPSEDFVSSKHIMDKLECMSDAIRQTFDTTSWENNTFWERFAS